MSAKQNRTSIDELSEVGFELDEEDLRLTVGGSEAPVDGFTSIGLTAAGGVIERDWVVDSTT